MPTHLTQIRGYKTLVKKIQSELSELDFFVKSRTAESYWKVGKYIHEHILENKDRADYGNELFKSLGRDVDRDESTLRKILRFYRTYPIQAARPEKYKSFVGGFLWHTKGDKFYYVKYDRLYRYTLRERDDLDVALAPFYGNYFSRWVEDNSVPVRVEFVQADIRADKISKKVLESMTMTLTRSVNLRDMLIEKLKAQGVGLNSVQDVMPARFGGSSREKGASINFQDSGKYVQFDYHRGGLVIYQNSGVEYSFLPTGVVSGHETRHQEELVGWFTRYYEQDVLFSPDLRWALINSLENDPAFYLIRADGKIKRYILK